MYGKVKKDFPTYEGDTFLETSKFTYTLNSKGCLVHAIFYRRDS